MICLISSNVGLSCEVNIVSVCQSPAFTVEPGLMASVIISVSAKVGSLEYTVKQMLTAASQILAYKGGSYFYFSISKSKKVYLTHNI